ncbi:hypothetical protein HY008_03175 [Candidatus Woesebacteria bacterium]|nr:hypothetical protein [Candidatus Woesebacteria bacterium]
MFSKQASWFDAWDINAYVSYIRYAERHGSLMLENTYTTIPHTPVFVFQYYTFLGLINRLLHLDPFLLFHLASILTTALLATLCFFIAKTFIPPKDRLLMTTTIIFGGGLGWIPFLEMKSADMVTPDFTFIKPFTIGHDALSISLSLLSILLFYLYSQKKKILTLIIAILAGFGAGVFHPYKLLWLVIIGLVWAIKEKKKFSNLLLYPLGLIILFAVYYPIGLTPFIKNPGLAGVWGESFTSANLFSIILGFGLWTPFIIWKLLIGEAKTEAERFIKLCFMSQLLLLFTPLPYSRQFIPAMYALGSLFGYFAIKELITSPRYRSLALTILVIASTVSMLHVFKFLTFDVKPTNHYFYLLSSEEQALKFINTLPKESNILSLYRLGNVIPAFSDNKVFFGHFMQTPNSEKTLKIAQRFYLYDNETDQRQFLKDNHIDYIYYGLEEAYLRKSQNLLIDNPYPYFPIIYQNDSIIIYDTAPKS